MEPVTIKLSGQKYTIDLEKIIYREIDNEIYIFDAENAMLHYLDKIAAVFFEILCNNCYFDMALKEISTNFCPNVYDKVCQDYWLFCEKLIDRHIIKVVLETNE